MYGSSGPLIAFVENEHSGPKKLVWGEGEGRSWLLKGGSGSRSNVYLFRKKEVVHQRTYSLRGRKGVRGSSKVEIVGKLFILSQKKRECNLLARGKGMGYGKGMQNQKTGLLGDKAGEIIEGGGCPRRGGRSGGESQFCKEKMI